MIRSISGVRGVVGQDVDAATVFRYTQAFAELQTPGPVLLARDSRPHGERLMNAAAQALRQVGRKVILADLAPTPTAQFITPRKHLAGAIVLTASHNPVDYNGLKFIGHDGCFLNEQQVTELFSRADGIEAPSEMPIRRVRSRLSLDAVGLHLLDTLNLSCISVDAILRKRFKVVVDAVNGAASHALPTLLEALGCEVVTLHTTPDGTFPRGPEPLAEHLSDLRQAVVDQGADLGLATDPDADRLALVDETGMAPGEELTQVLAVDGFLRRTSSRSPVVTNLSSSLLLEHVAQRYGVEVQRSPVGEVHVVDLMRTLGSEIGGEGNGGVILAESHLGRDSLVAAALILDRLAQEEASLSTILSQLPEYYLIKDKIAVDGYDSEEVSRRMTERFPDAEPITLDGLKLLWSDRWVLIRKSNTEPIIRLFAEAASEAGALELIRNVREIIGATESGHASGSIS
ncbi:MAG: phosphoglucosamine mutase [Fidelibacterota bacterium]|nr:MAG: phosphoglucosamine mutase [Candidatus Neomarinimicrobiota bacterium]